MCVYVCACAPVSAMTGVRWVWWQADRVAALAKWKGGVAPLWSTSTADLDELGAGVTLYFRTIKSFAVLFLCMSVLAVPGLYVAVTGNRSGSGEFSIARLSLAEAGPLVRDTTGARVFLLCALPTTMRARRVWCVVLVSLTLCIAAHAVAVHSTRTGRSVTPRHRISTPRVCKTCPSRCPSQPCRLVRTPRARVLLW